jgi:glucose-1-phosphate thymidylyltransferase
MKIIIPMAGMGKRMRPHTLTVPKPLIPIAGKPIVHRLVEDIAAVLDQQVEEVGFVISRNFGEEVEQRLVEIAGLIGAKGSIYYQDSPLGTGHAILCAEPMLNGPVIVAFADTLFRANFRLDASQDGIIWVKQVEDPSAFGVVELSEKEEITGFVEKPATYVSDLAIIGIYYFKNGGQLKEELQYLIDNEVMHSNEYQLTDALENMKEKGTAFTTGKVEEWLDCGNKDATVNSNKRYLDFIKDQPNISASAYTENSVIIQPVYIGPNVSIHNSVIGPHVSIGEHTVVKNSRIQNTIVQTHTTIENANLENSMIGSHVGLQGKASDLSIGDYNAATM